MISLRLKKMSFVIRRVIHLVVNYTPNYRTHRFTDITFVWQNNPYTTSCISILSSNSDITNENSNDIQYLLPSFMFRFILIYLTRVLLITYYIKRIFSKQNIRLFSRLLSRKIILLVQCHRRYKDVYKFVLWQIHKANRLTFHLNVPVINNIRYLFKNSNTSNIQLRRRRTDAVAAGDDLSVCSDDRVTHRPQICSYSLRTKVKSCSLI